MSEFGQELIVAMEDAAAHARGEASGVCVTTIEIPTMEAICNEPELFPRALAGACLIPLTTLRD